MNKLIKKGKLKNSFLRQEGATALFLTLIITMSMLFVAITASDIIRNGLQMSQASLHSTKAYYGAESGIERMLWEVRKNGHDPVADSWEINNFNGDCVHYTNETMGNIAVAPTAGCGAVNTKQTLASNGVEYSVEYIEDTTSSPPDTIVKFKSLGNYKNITKRAVQIAYVD